MNDEFYIGWESTSPPGIRRASRKILIALSLVVVLAPVVLAAFQHAIGRSAFEWGTVKTFSGVLQTQPYPHLLVPRPGSATQSSDMPQYSTYYLVAPWKFGLDPEALAPLGGKAVTLRGSLIYRDNRTMIETKPEWIRASGDGPATPPPRAVSLGKQTVVGEIVDSKCFFGVMNPGHHAPHRACAVRCISGGIPPVVLVRQKDAPAVCLLLVSTDGKPVNHQVLDMVAEPVEITGEVERQGELLIMRADPATYRRKKWSASK